MADNKHLTLSDRIFIEKALNDGKSRKAIADYLGKDKSTICKEIKKHTVIVPFTRIQFHRTCTYDCTKIKECGFKGLCSSICDRRIPVPCRRKDSSSGVCNGCPDRTSCKLTKKLYVAEEAHTEYRDTLVDSRIGWDLSYSDAKALADILKPLLKQGQSLDVILRNHPEIKYCEKTLYNYIEQGALSQFGITNMDLRRKVSRRMTKKKKESYKPRQDRKYLKGRTYDDFLEYIKEHPEASVVEMDTVYNDISNGPFMQTFQFVKQHFMKGVFHDTKTADDMYEGVKLIYNQLGKKNFKKLVQVILTDRGSEFTCADRIEALGCKIFYCDPMCSWQKPHVENNHVLLRYVCPKEKDLRKLGLDSQEKLDLVFSHVNSYGRESLSGKSPYETFEFFHPDSDILDRLKIKKVAPDDIILKPELLKK